MVYLQDFYNFENHVLRVTLDLESPSLCSDTVAYTQNPAVLKITFCHSSFSKAQHI